MEGLWPSFLIYEWMFYFKGVHYGQERHQVLSGGGGPAKPSNYRSRGYRSGGCISCSKQNGTETKDSFANWNVMRAPVRDTFCLRGGKGHLIHGRPGQGTAGWAKWLPATSPQRDKRRQLQVRWEDKRLLTKGPDYRCEFNYTPSARVQSIFKGKKENNFLRLFPVFKMVKISPQKVVK